MDWQDPEMLRMDAASDWLLRLHEQSLSEEEMFEWVRWCESDPANMEAFERLRTVWNQYGELKADASPGASQKQGSPHATLAPAISSQRPTRQLRGGERRRSLPGLQGLAAGVAASALLLAAGAAYHLWQQRSVLTEFVAATGNRATTLPDGSSLELGARTTVAVDFNGLQRHLTMSSGQAYFKVHHDKLHPFVVHAGAVSVTAVGTAFDVRREPGRVVVTVEEGVVRIARIGAASPSSADWIATAGYQLAYSEKQQTATVTAVDAKAYLAWREGRLIYAAEPLGAVVDDVNRYSTHRIVIHDGRIAAMIFSGTVFTGSVDDWLSSVTLAFHLRATRQPDGAVLLETSS